MTFWGHKLGQTDHKGYRFLLVLLSYCFWLALFVSYNTRNMVCLFFFLFTVTSECDTKHSLFLYYPFRANALGIKDHIQVNLDYNCTLFHHLDLIFSEKGPPETVLSSQTQLQKVGENPVLSRTLLMRHCYLNIYGM